MPGVIKPPIFGLVYKATNTINGKVYIGITSGTLKDRISKHVSVSRTIPKYRYYFQNAMNKYGPDAFLWEVVEECFSEKELDEKERFYIKQYQSNIPQKGYNLTSGGGRSHPLEIEHRERISAANKGRKFTQERCDKISKALTGLKKSAEANANNARAKERPVQQLDKDGNVICEYPSLSAAARAHDTHNASISRVCTGKGKSCAGWGWRFAGEAKAKPRSCASEETKKIMSDRQKGRKATEKTKLKMSKLMMGHDGYNRKAILKLDLDGNILEEFSSVSEAAEKCGLGLKSISLVCRGEQTTPHGGFMWRFKNEDDFRMERKHGPENKQERAVVWLDTEGTILGEFPSIAEASRKSGVGYSSISKTCGGSLKTGGGFIWKYKEEAPKND
jgi:group I intron endonuclease